MAGKRIKGITIEIDGETKGLNKALSAITTQSNNVSKELKDVERLLKLDPGNTELVAQKQELLGNQIGITEERLDALRNAQSQVDAQFAKGEIGEEQYRAFNREIEATEAALKGYRTQLTTTQSDQDSLAQNTKRLDTFFEATGSSVEDFQDILGSRLTKAIRDGSASADDMQVALNKIGKSAMGSRGDIDQFKSTLDSVDGGTSLNKIDQDLRDLSVQADDSGDALKDMSNKLDAGNLLEGAEALGEVSDALLDIASISFEDAMNISGLVHDFNNAFGLVGEEASNTKNLIVDMYNSGIVESYEEAKEVLTSTKEQLRGINEADLGKVASKAQNFASTFDTDVDESLRGVNALMTTYGLTVDEAFDLMTVGAQNGLNKTDELGDNLAEYSGLFEESGYSAKDMFEILQGGLDGGAYNLDKVNDLVKEFGVRVSDGTVEAALSDMGGGFEDLFNTWEKGGGTNKELFDSLANEIAGMSSEQEKATAISQIFGSLGEDAGYKVIESMGSLSREMTGVQGQYEDVTDASEKLNESSDSTSLTEMWRNLMDMLRPIGEEIMRIALDILPKVIDVIQGIVDGFKGLSGLDQMILIFAGVFVVLAAVLAPIIALVMGIVGVLGTFIGPIGIIIAIIAALITAIMNWGSITGWLSEKWAQFSEWIGQLWTNIKETISTKLSEISESMKEIWSNIVDWIFEKLASLEENFIQIMESIKGFLSAGWHFVYDIITNALTSILNMSNEKFQEVLFNIQMAMESIWIVIDTIWNYVKETFLNATAFLKALVTGDFATMKDIVGEQITLMKDTLNKIWIQIKVIFSNVVNAIIAFVQGAFSNLKNNVTITIRNLQNILSSIWNAIKNTAMNIWNSLKSAVINIITGFKNNVSNSISALRNTLSNIWNSIRSTATNLWGGIRSSVTNIVNSLKASVSNIFNSLKSTVSRIWNNIKSAITNPITTAKNTVKRLIDQMKGFFNFKWKLPSIKMPRFSISGSKNPIDWISQGVPKLKVDWFAKGGIMTKPTVFGRNGDSLMAGGEAGPEAIAPIDKLMGYVQQAVDNRMAGMDENFKQMIQLLTIIAMKDNNINMDGKSVMEIVDQHLNNKKQSTEFGKTGRVGG